MILGVVRIIVLKKRDGEVGRDSIAMFLKSFTIHHTFLDDETKQNEIAATWKTNRRHQIRCTMFWNKAVQTALNVYRLKFPAKKRDFSLPQVSRLALRPTQAPIECAGGGKIAGA